MARGAIFSPEKARLIEDVIEYLLANGYIAKRRVNAPVFGSLDPCYFKNNSGETVPPYACMQVTDTLNEDDRNYAVIAKPADQFLKAGPYVFNGPGEVIDQDTGVYQQLPYIVALTNGTITDGARYSPTAGQWYLSASISGLYVCQGSDTVSEDCARFSIEYGAILYRFTLNGSLASGTATADILLMDGTDTGHDETVRDPLAIFSTLTTDDAGLCLLQDGKFYVIQAPC